MKAFKKPKLPKLGVKKANKYLNRRTQVDGIWFASLAESQRYSVLKERVKNGEITNLQLQKDFELSPYSIISIKYRSDFCYEQGGKLVVEDVKSPALMKGIFSLKAKLFRGRYGYDIKVVDCRHVFSTD